MNTQTKSTSIFSVCMYVCAAMFVFVCVWVCVLKKFIHGTFNRRYIRRRQYRVFTILIHMYSCVLFGSSIFSFYLCLYRISIPVFVLLLPFLCCLYSIEWNAICLFRTFNDPASTRYTYITYLSRFNFYFGCYNIYA